MDKSHIAKFLKNRRRGIYKVIVEQYADDIIGIGVNLALELIKEDLEKDGEKIELNYFSLAQAISKFKRVNPEIKLKNSNYINTKKREKYVFKDAHELTTDHEKKPGSFRLGNQNP